MKQVNKRSHSPNKNPKKDDHGDWHVSNTSMGMGDYYGIGIKAKLGRMREGVGMQKVSPNGLKTPPRSVV